MQMRDSTVTRRMAHHCGLRVPMLMRSFVLTMSRVIVMRIVIVRPDQTWPLITHRIRALMWSADPVSFA